MFGRNSASAVGFVPHTVSPGTMPKTSKKSSKSSSNGVHEYRNVHMEGGNGSLESEKKRRRGDHFGKPWREQKEIEDNPIGLRGDAAESMLADLDELQSSFWVLYHQYHKHHWLVEGPQFMELHRFLEAHYEEVHRHLDALAERMTALGGIPTSDPVNQARLAHIQHEPEGTYRIRPALLHDRYAERDITIGLRASLQKASELGDFGTRKLLEGILLRTEERAHHLDHYLGEDSLEIGLTAKASDVMEQPEK